ncbi:MAG: UvrD-helicase domain-containing protein [Bacilli bacterium]|nr:UvrD-helicase domain-containing protein [Bacilli bacterium]
MKPDKYQIKAIKTKAKNLLILAGAGSGKTYTIVEKIKQLIKDGIKEEQILCISFTKESALSLQKKIKKQNIEIKVKTFHSLGYKIINKYKEVNIVKNNILGNIIEKELKEENHLKEITKVHFITIGKEDKIIKKIQNNIILSSKHKDKLKNIIQTFINLYKGNNMNKKDYETFKKTNENNNIFNEKQSHKYFLNLTEKILKKYERYLRKNNEIDYNDMINLALKIVKKKKNIFSYKYIIIDEYQDISFNKLNLIKEIQKQTGSNLIVVGDDFQSIYSFTGSNIDVIINFKKHFKKTKIKKLKYTYRNSKELLKITQKFICQNPYQIKKNLKSRKTNKYPIIIYYYKNDIKEVWDKVEKIIGENQTLILGRNNKDKYKLPKLKENMKYLTIHKSKGLESENTIIINLEDRYDSIPSKIEDNEYLKYVKSEKDKFKYSEERRLFYVALTRCKKNNILLVKKNNPSIFVKEILKNNKKNIKIIDNI